MSENVVIQSNSIRKEKLHKIVDMTINEILCDIKGMLGPGATDAFITKDGAPYYTRDGKEVLESLIFDNELSNYVHHILYQAAYHQGQEIGDGSTTLTVFYCHIYNHLRELIKNGDLTASINQMREAWKWVTGATNTLLENSAMDLTDDLLLSMLYTCTQDADLAARLHHKLGSALMAGAYIVPRKSNIASDFRVTTYNRPVIPVTKMYSLKPISATEEHAVALYCNGKLDIAHTDILAAMVNKVMMVGTSMLPVTLVILCHGVTEATRRTLREFNRELKLNNWNPANINNVAIYTMDNYRKMDQEEIEDIASIITDEPGFGGDLVNAITFEHLLYHVFRIPDWPPVTDLESYDIDPHAVDQMIRMLQAPYEVMFDDAEGMAIGKVFGPIASERYQKLVDEIAEEKSPIRKHSLNKRLRNSFGMFIDIEVGSSLLKDSQRKFELILDAVLSGSTAAKEKVICGNSMIAAYRTLLHVAKLCSNPIEEKIVGVLMVSIEDVIYDLAYNYDSTHIQREDLAPKMADLEYYALRDFSFKNEGNEFWPAKYHVSPPKPIETSFEGEDGSSIHADIDPVIVEPLGSIKAIVENSTLPMELAMTEVFHISARTGFMNNFIDNEV